MRAAPAVWPGAPADVWNAARAEYSRRLAVAYEAARNQGRPLEAIRAGIMRELGLSEADVARLFSENDIGRSAPADSDLPPIS